jgi:hypothetical protein
MVLYSDDCIPTQELIAKRIVQAKAFGRMSGAGDHTPIEMIWQPRHILQPDINHPNLVLVVWSEQVKIVKSSSEGLMITRLTNDTRFTFLVPAIMRIKGPALTLVRIGERPQGIVPPAIFPGFDQIVSQDRGGNGGVTNLAQEFNAARMIWMQVSQNDKIDIGCWAMQEML